MLSLLIIFFAVALLFSFLCSMWEAVLLSVTPAWAQIQLQQGSKTGAHLHAFKQNIDRPLAAILTLNTIAHTVGAIGVGNQAAAIWADSNPLLTQLVIPAGMTLAILILSEIIPKTLGALHWQRLAPFTVMALNALISVLAPLIWLSERITGVFKKGAKTSIYSRHDFVAMAEIVADQGVIRDTESAVIRNLLRLESVRAGDAMTPRTVLKTGQAEQSIAGFHAAQPSFQFSRIPIHSGDRDAIDGYVLRVDLLTALLGGRGDAPLSSLRRPMPSFNELTPLPTLFDKLISGRSHMALVVDEYGGVEGIITVEDVLETLLGLEIVDELDSATDMQQLARRRWTQRARELGLVEADAGQRAEPAGPDDTATP